MRIGLHKEFGNASIGGAEYMIAVLAEALSAAQHQVEIIHHHPGLSKEVLTATFGTPLERVHLRCEPEQARCARRSLNPIRKYREARARYADLSRGLDLFVTFVHGEEPPPFCRAAVGVLVVLFQLSQRPKLWPYTDNGGGLLRRLKERAGRHYLEWEWQRRLDTYHVKTGISEFVRLWTRRLWGIDCQLLYPPVDNGFLPGNKAPVVLSVGRYSTLKNQLALVTAFRGIGPLPRGDWKLVCTGGVGSSPFERDYYEAARKLASGYPIEVLANVNRSELRTWYEKSRVFWHAAGFGDNEEKEPGQSEHFGIATVEAMAAGCVPVVIRKGAQPELVDHGKNGFLWDTIEELQEYTRLLAQDESLRQNMAAAAQKRAQDFSTHAFVRRFRALVAPSVSGAGIL
jgi:glycosyltransferase involved in cell wall biosynthesis